MLKHNKVFFVFSFLLLAWFVACFFIPISSAVLVVILLSWFLITGWGVFDIRLQYFLPSYNNIITSQKKIALTFDDGPGDYTEQVLDLLKKYNVKATFFLIGKHIEKNPTLCLRMYHEGHTLGNHTYSHSNSFGFMTANDVMSEIEFTDQLFMDTVGKRPLLFRPPFGVTNPRIAKALQHTKHDVIGWNIRSLDTVIKNGDTIYNRIKNKIKPGGIILMHDTSLASINALEQLLQTLKNQNYDLVTVDQLLQTQPYEN